MLRTCQGFIYLLIMLSLYGCAEVGTGVGTYAIGDAYTSKEKIEGINKNSNSIKHEADTPVEKKVEPEPKVIFPQSIETTKAVEYASIFMGAKIRFEASLKSEVLRNVPPGYPVTILEKQPNWLLVDDYLGRKGWVYASLVTKPRTVIIKVSKGNLRNGPSLKNDIIVQLVNGTIMYVLEKRGEWLKVSDKEDLTGWLHLSVIWPEAEMNAKQDG